MADDAAKGVVDHVGRVFDPQGGGVHEGLYVCDGSVVPVALAANPLLTISAIAERTADMLIRDRNWGAGQADGPAGADRQAPAARAEALGMPCGPAHLHRTHDRVRVHARPRRLPRGHDGGRDDGALVEVLLTIDYEDVQAVLDDPRCDGGHFRHGARAGAVAAPPDRHAGTLHAAGSRPVAGGDLAHAVPDGPAGGGRETVRLRWPQGDPHARDSSCLVRHHHAVHDDQGSERPPGTAPGYCACRRPTSPGCCARMDVRGVPLRKQREYRLAFGAFFAGEMVRMYGGALDEPGAFPSEPGQAPAAVREPRDPDGIWWYDEPARMACRRAGSATTRSCA